MELKSNYIQLNLLKKDCNGNFTSTDLDQCQKSDTVYEYDKRPKKNIEPINEILLDEIKDLPDANISFSDFTGYIYPYLSRCIPLGFNRLMPICMALVAQTCLGWYDDAVQSGGYGLGQVLFFCLFNMIMSIHSEYFGIFLTEKYGKGDWKGMRVVFLRALSFKAFFVVFNCFWLSFTKPVLTLQNFDSRIVDIVSELMFYMIPSLLPVALNVALQTYQISQKITKPLTYLNFINIVQMIPFGYIFIWKAGLKLKGFALLRFSIEIVTLIGLIISTKQCMDKRAYEFSEKISEIFSWKYFKDYIQQLWPILYGWYSSYLAFEICLVIVGNTHDIDFLASYVISLHIMITWMAFSVGIAQITRTDVIMRISQNHPIMGKKYAYLGLIMVFILSVIACSFMVMFSKQLSEMFTSQPEVLVYLYYMVPVAGITAVPFAMFSTFSTILRVMKQSTILARIYIITMLIFMLCGSYIIQFWTNQFKGCIIWTFFAARFLSCIAGFIIIRNYDWKSIQSN